MKENTSVNFTLNDHKKYINLLSEIIELKKQGPTPKAYVRTYGCQQNISDSEKIQGVLSSAGFSFTTSINDADLILFNTCAVRENAEDRVFGNVGALKSLKLEKPSLTIALCGCMMEQEHIANKIKKSFPYVDLVFGTNSIHKFPKYYYNTLTGKTRVFKRDEDDNKIHEGIPVKRDGVIKGWLPIMYGCDNFCSYCVVPHVRGRERSRSKDSIIKEAKSMIDAGYKEITLLGQNVNSYGKGLKEKTNFSGLLKEIDNIDGDYWLRFMTSHPKDCTKELIDTIANSKHITKQLHLPIQSGSNRILKLMNRGYTKEQYLDIANYAKEKIPGLSLTSDIIVGFPSETYEDFKETLSLIKEVGFSSLFTFIYSPRVGTPAADMEDLATKESKSKWFTELLKTQDEISANIKGQYLTKTEKVLVEGNLGKEKTLNGRTSGSVNVEFNGNENLVGTFQNIKIIDEKSHTLKGEIV